MAVKRLLQVRPQYDDSNGALASNYRLFFYAAGSSTKQNTYNSSTGTVANSNPITLNALGEIPGEVWGTVGQMYKIGFAIPGVDDPPASFVWTEDNVAGINDATVTLDEWISGPAPTYVSATSFTLTGDQTTQFHPGRRLKSTVTAGTSYGTIISSVFGALTTVTVDTTGSNPLDSGLSAVSYGLLRADNFAQSVGLDAAARQSADIASAGTLNLDQAGGDLVDVTGTTTITAITLARGKMRTVRFTGALTLTNGASLVLPGGANITSAAGDFAIFRGYAASVVRCVTYVKATGKSVINIANTQPTRQTLTSGTGATYTTPAGATRINVRMTGGGGAGGPGGGAGAANGTAGGNTTFSTLTANGGAVGTQTTGGAAGTASGGDVNLSGGSGTGPQNPAGTTAGGQGGGTPFGGGGGGGPTAGQAGAANTGGGGGGGNGGSGSAGGGGGGAGGYVEKLILAPAATYTYTVGAGGTASTAGTGGSAGGAGGAGIIVVDEWYD